MGSVSNSSFSLSVCLKFSDRYLLPFNMHINLNWSSSDPVVVIFPFIYRFRSPHHALSSLKGYFLVMLFHFMLIDAHQKMYAPPPSAPHLLPLRHKCASIFSFVHLRLGFVDLLGRIGKQNHVVPSPLLFFSRCSIPASLTYTATL